MTNQVNVVNRGFEYVTQYLSTGATTTWIRPTFVGWGTANGSNATSTQLPASSPGGVQGAGQWYDVGPFSESTETRQSGAATVIGTVAAAGTITTQVVATITSTSTQSIGESFLVMSATKPSEYILNSNVLVGATAFTVTTGTLVNGYYQMNNEVVQITGVSSNTIASAVTRGVNGSSAQAAHAGDGLSFGNIPGAGTSNPGNGDMFAHAGFIALALNNGDSIQFTWMIGVTS